MFCPGEAVGTLKSLGFAEPQYARFAGVSLMIRFTLSEDRLEQYSVCNQYIAIHKKGSSSTMQARYIGKQLFIAIAGTKAFYGDQEPHKDQAFAKNSNLWQLNVINDVHPVAISLALPRVTHGMPLNEVDMRILERKHIAERWVGSRAVAYDGFPTLGPVYNHNGQVINARCTTHLGSGGASFSPAAILVSRSSMFKEQAISNDLAEKVLAYGNSQRTSTI